MLTLQRASAGSGKTYTLTKRYLRLLISIKDEQTGRRRLRTNTEISDSAKHILAVTFTNKATNEMKERILSKLNDLAYPPSNGKSPDYMLDFIKEFDASPTKISEVCREALAQVLFNYSDFNISTIDAFFQVILRTFAYEVDLPDSYQLVIDSGYLARLAAKSLIDDLGNGDLQGGLTEWVASIVDHNVRSGNNGWKIFQQKEKENIGIGNDNDIFTRICKMALQLDKEDYKDIRENLETYFASHDIYKSYIKVKEKMEQTCSKLFSEMRSQASRLVNAYTNLLIRPDLTSHHEGVRDWPSVIAGGRNTTSQLRKILAPNADIFEPRKWSGPVPGKSLFASTAKDLKNISAPELTDIVEDFVNAHTKWTSFLESDDYKIWSLIEDGLSRMAIMHNLRERIASYLLENDAMQLADTNTILRRIISDDDVPFIYERIGSTINHFLIDEFQDTSRLQWINFHPLLSQSISNGNENLIIGDAKQSIYRFRNADSTLITDTVPKIFANDVEIRGYSVDENSNWRSTAQVVEFNNFLFKALSDYLDEITLSASRTPISDLYSNTVQTIRKVNELGATDDEGYVEINYYPHNDDPAEPTSALAGNNEISPVCLNESVSSSDAGNVFNPESVNLTKIPFNLLIRIGHLIDDLLRRGYQQSDIAILVNSRSAGEDIISGLIAYSEYEREGLPKLMFVSEDSLRLGRSEAIGRIIECLRKIQFNTEGLLSDENTPPDQQGVNPNKTDNNEKFSSPFNDVEIADLDEMISDMQAITLPSLVEAMVERYLDISLRQTEAPFIAAFQDAVLEYCEHQPSDIASLLRWWDRYGKNLTLSAPEGADAINVMTIHKSKGLEFECVILPELDLNFELSGEWAWVDLPQSFSYASDFPDKVLMKFTTSLAAENNFPFYQEKYAELNYLNVVDQLNKAYVAATRAVRELYIFFPDNSPAGRLGGMVKKLILENDDSPFKDEYNTSLPEEIVTLSLGNQVDDAGTLKKRHAEGKDRNSKMGNKVEKGEIRDYFVNSDRDILKYHPEGVKPYLDPEEDDDRIDPRSEGTLLHAVMENVIVEEDLPRAFAKIRSRGMINREEIEKYLPLMKNALESVRPYSWFAPEMKIFTERAVLERSPKMRRPDRLIITPKGEGIVIDYKFGSDANSAAHHRQVANYMRLFRLTGLPSHVRGFLWYPFEKKVVEVFEKH